MMHSTSSQWLQPLSHSSTPRFPTSTLPFNHLHQTLPPQSSSSVILTSQLNSSQPLFPLSNTSTFESQSGTFLSDMNSEAQSLDPLAANYYGFSHDLVSGIGSPGNLWYNPSTPVAPMTGSIQRDCNVNVDCSSALGRNEDPVQMIPPSTSSSSKAITPQLYDSMLGIKEANSSTVSENNICPRLSTHTTPPPNFLVEEIITVQQ
ncbi:unnamed protein product [Heterobilharzia americana]|nr:unnamed protein product [Heterobilharzia americana]